MRDDILIGDTPKAARRKDRLKRLPTQGKLRKHATLADVDDVLVPDTLARMFTFTLVRNPWDRVVSYYHWLQHQSFEHPSVHLAKNKTFKAFLSEPYMHKGFQASSARSFMTDAQGRENCNLYIRLEHFADDALPLFEHLGFEFSLPHVNRSARDRDFRKYYEAETRDLVASACAEDIARFGYAFECPERS